MRTLVVIFALCLPAHAVSNAGSTGASFLELGVGARAGAMGEANTAWADDVYGMYFNPAGIARIGRQEVGFFHNNLFLDLSYNSLGYVRPVGELAAIGATVLYVDLGEIDRTTVASGIANTIIGRASGHDVMGSLTYARALSRKLDIGISLKVIHESLDRFSATAGAVDFGVKWREPLRGLTLGASLLNLGTRLQFVREHEELPITLRLGAGWRSENRRWGLASDVALVKDQDLEAKLGGEFWIWPDRFAVRAGVNSATDVGNNLTAGAAFRWNDIGIDYAYVPFGEIGDQNLVSLTYEFGPARPERDWIGGAVHSPPMDAPEQLRDLWVAPFEYHDGPPEHAWMRDAAALVLRQRLKRAGMMAASASEAQLSLQGEYIVAGEILFVTGRVLRQGRVVRRFHASGDVARPFLVWDEVIRQVRE